MPIIMQCSPTDAGATPATVHGHQIYTQTTHHNLVLGTYERNGYDDSDFFAATWNPEKQRVDYICYATTRGWTYGNGAIVDATPEVFAAARQYIDNARNTARAKWDALAAQIPAKGSTVRIRVSKGKNARFNNCNGRVFWLGAGYARGTERVGVDINGEKVFLDDRNVWAILANGEPAELRWDEARAQWHADRRFAAADPDFRSIF